MKLAAFRSSYQKKLIEKLKENSEDSSKWNPLYFRIDAVVDAIADRYDVSKADILSPEAQELVDESINLMVGCKSSSYGNFSNWGNKRISC